MQRILVSWVAWYFDFLDGELNTEGPSYALHQKGWSLYSPDCHLLLDPSGGEDIRSEVLYTGLTSAFPDHQTDLIPAKLADPMDFQEIRIVLREVLEPFQDEELMILISSGTTPMRTSWILFHLEENGFQTTLLQGMGPQVETDSGFPAFRRLKLDHNLYAGQLMAKYQDQGRSSPHVLTETLKQVYTEAELVAEADPVPVLIQGESGTGKELLAHYIHQHSPRKSRQMLSINCAALDNQLLESRLFGYRKGSFTGAHTDRKGMFQELDGGTIFLDEIGDISSALQQSLLRVLQQGEVLRIGSSKVEKVNVRILAATNRNLWEACKSGSFRWDLYYRLSVAPIRIPALRQYPMTEKREILQHFVRNRTRIGKKGPMRIKPEVESRMLAHSFPGNIRELDNLVTSLYIFSSNGIVTEDLLDRLLQKEPERWDMSLAAAERLHIHRVLEAFGGNQTHTARALGIAVNTLKRKLEQGTGEKS